MCIIDIKRIWIQFLLKANCNQKSLMNSYIEWRQNIRIRNIIIRIIYMGLVFQNNKDCRMLFRLSYKPCKVNEVNEQRTCHSSHVKNGDVFCTHIFLQYCINWKGLPLHFHAWEAETFFTAAVLVGYSMLN